MSAKVLVAPLDWGLGHATRSVPIIQKLLDSGAEVSLGVSGGTGAFFAGAFPALKQFELPGYSIVYPRHGFAMPFWLLSNLPRLLGVVRREHELTEALVRREKFSLVISDNRFGCYSRAAKSVYMTHQLRIAFPACARAFEGVGVGFHKSVMKNFDEVWVPDLAEAPGLAGRLSHLAKPSHGNVKFVGPLSRFQLEGAVPKVPPPKKFKYLGVVSGVEPARTALEAKLLAAFKELPGRHALLLGKPAHPGLTRTEANVSVFAHLPALEFAAAVLGAERFVARPGYSTVMDLCVLGANALFVPTPGQTEQEYLGRALARAGAARCLKQGEVAAPALERAFQGAARRLPSVDFRGLDAAVKGILEAL